MSDPYSAEAGRRSRSAPPLHLNDFRNILSRQRQVVAEDAAAPNGLRLVSAELGRMTRVVHQLPGSVGKKDRTIKEQENREVNALFFLSVAAELDNDPVLASRVCSALGHEPERHSSPIPTTGDSLQRDADKAAEMIGNIRKNREVIRDFFGVLYYSNGFGGVCDTYNMRNAEILSLGDQHHPALQATVRGEIEARPEFVTRKLTPNDPVVLASSLRVIGNHAKKGLVAQMLALPLDLSRLILDLAWRAYRELR